MNLNIININSEPNPNYQNGLVNEAFSVQLYNESTLNFNYVKEQDVFILSYINEADINLCYEIMMKVKKETERPVYIMTEKLSSVERLIYLKLGVIGFLPLDFTLEELYLLFKNRREYDQKNQKKKNNMIDYKCDLHLDRENRLAVRRNKEVQLSIQEFDFLNLLYKNPERAVSYKEIYGHLWFDDEFERGGKQKIANVALRVRLKLNLINKEHEYVKSVRSLGYRFNRN
jgi:DNA-binding response OmpR family regulator